MFLVLLDRKSDKDEGYVVLNSLISKLLAPSFKCFTLESGRAWYVMSREKRHYDVVRCAKRSQKMGLRKRAILS